VGDGAPHLESKKSSDSLGRPLWQEGEGSQCPRGQDEEEGDGGEEEEGSSEFLPGYPAFEDYSKVSGWR